MQATKAALRIAAATAAVVPTTAVVQVATTAPVVADPTDCNMNRVDTGWGSGAICKPASHFEGWVDDTAADGHCVRAEWRTSSTAGWQYMTQSCGDKVGFVVPDGMYQVRMVQTGTGYWSILWTP